MAQEWLSSLISAGGSIANGLFGFFGQQETNKSTERINRQQMALQREAWQREDNAVRRRMADLKAAGLNPALAAGSAASSSGPSISLNATESALSQFGGMGQGIANALKFGKEQKLLDSQVKLAQKSVEQKNEESKNYARESALNYDILGYNAQVKRYEAEVARYIKEQIQWNADHKKSREVREWIGTFADFVPKFKISL